ncbi:hypothetical protein R3P38DRAFT_3246162 [Favolaschia claudopus]|uniref:Uncharacterized protein n=1 Tax=Favolaschia claudopus TaxID=2862362 RepID=A0AAV9YZ92_9AGAR
MGPQLVATRATHSSSSSPSRFASRSLSHAIHQGFVCRLHNVNVQNTALLVLLSRTLFYSSTLLLTPLLKTDSGPLASPNAASSIRPTSASWTPTTEGNKLTTPLDIINAGVCRRHSPLPPLSSVTSLNDPLTDQTPPSLHPRRSPGIYGPLVDDGHLRSRHLLRLILDAAYQTPYLVVEIRRHPFNTFASNSTSAVDNGLDTPQPRSPCLTASLCRLLRCLVALTAPPNRVTQCGRTRCYIVQACHRHVFRRPRPRPTQTGDDKSALAGIVQLLPTSSRFDVYAGHRLRYASFATAAHLALYVTLNTLSDIPRKCALYPRRCHSRLGIPPALSPIPRHRVALPSSPLSFPFAPSSPLSLPAYAVTYLFKLRQS